MPQQGCYSPNNLLCYHVIYREAKLLHADVTWAEEKVSMLIEAPSLPVYFASQS